MKSFSHPTDLLPEDVSDRTFVDNLGFNALGDIRTAGMEVPLPGARALLHRSHRAHPVKVLDVPSVVEAAFSGCFFGAGKQVPHHHAFSPGGKRFHDVS